MVSCFPGPQRAKDVLGVDKYESIINEDGRVMQLNVWRPINGPVKRSPLAFADASSIPKNDLVETDQIFPNRTGEIYHISFSENHKWYWVSEMKNDEVLSIQSYLRMVFENDSINLRKKDSEDNMVDFFVSEENFGDIRFNNGTYASATAIYIDDADADGGATSADVLTWDDSTSTIKGYLHITDINDITTYARFKITAAVTDASGYTKVPLTYISGPPPPFFAF